MHDTRDLSKIRFIVLKDGGNYREYLQGELTENLEKNRKYRLSFYISNADAYNYAIKDLGILFIENPIIENININGIKKKEFV